MFLDESAKPLMVNVCNSVITVLGGQDDLDRDQLSKHGKGIELSAEDEDVIVLESIEGWIVVLDVESAFTFTL